MFKGLYRRNGSNGAPNTVQISDGDVSLYVTEDEYRAKGFMPSFDELPIRIVQRVPVIFKDGIYTVDQEWLAKNNPLPE